MRVGMIMARLPVLGPTHPKAWGLFFASPVWLSMLPIRRADAAPPYPCCARRLTDGFKRHWLGPGDITGAFFDCRAAMPAARPAILTNA